MALDLSGIGNVGEFFSQHYLDTLLESDLKELLATWAARDKEGHGKSPLRQLSALADLYFRAAARAAGEPSAVERWMLARDLHAHLLEALGYARNPGFELLDDDSVVPVLANVRHNGHPYLWVLEAPFAQDPEDADPLGEQPLQAQLDAVWRAASSASSATAPELAAEPYRDLLDGPLLRSADPPKWVLLLAGSDVYLIDRDKWPQGKYLRFEMGRLLGLRDPKALAAVCGLLHAEVLSPASGQSLLEQLDEKSHRHAFAVSTDLKFGAQQAIELLGNEAVRYRLSVSKQKTFNDGINENELTRECITYLYRLLFLFYVEARGAELGVVPMQSDAFRTGYSLDTLRDLELVPLTTDEARNGTFINDSLRKLFQLVQRGHGVGVAQQALTAGPIHATFTLRGLRSPLFDEERTPILRAVKFSNQTLQRVLQLLSLSREGKSKQRGRISYAQLGINQLGAVYEGLLSYSGFFAQEPLYEVRDAAELTDETARTYFVPAAAIGDYKPTEQVKDEHGRPLLHPKGTFLFRLSGRAREKSASYYTPEVLTQCLTKYTIKVRLGEPLLPEDETPETRAARLPADEILNLTLCEPAMGSGAFLNEAVNQLAHKYLEKKQEELGERIAAEDYQREWSKVKYHFAVHNCYGVDLNPLAAELGKVSLWLNVLQPDVEAPYLDERLAVGNSLIGARREVFKTHLLTEKQSKSNDSWLSAVPDRVPLRNPEAPPAPGHVSPTIAPRPPHTVYHFLVASGGFAAYADDAVVKELWPKQSEQLRAWRAALCVPFSATEVETLLALSDRVDELWQQWINERIERVAYLRQPVRVWGQALTEREKYWNQIDSLKDAATETRKRFRSEEEAEEIVAQRNLKAGSSHTRLKAAMDYWASLWFWPVLEAHLAPSRAEWLADLTALLSADPTATAQLGPSSRARLGVVERVSREQHFFHWELTFAEVFAQRGGMDVFLGNPPWVKVEWNESGVLGDLEPQLNLRKLSAKQVADRRKAVLEKSAAATELYLAELSGLQAQGAYIADGANFPLLKGVQGNLYKCFIERMWPLLSSKGQLGLWHQAGIFDDPNGGALRAALYQRATVGLRFKNELLLFSEVANQRIYAASVSSGAMTSNGGMVSMSNLFHPRTVDESFVHDGKGPVPGIKNDADNWDLRGHRSRLVRVTDDALKLFAKLYDPEGTPAREARLPVVHSAEILDVLRRFADGQQTLGHLGDQWYSTVCFDETGRVRDGTLKRDTRFPEGPGEWIVSGPHFYVGTPFNKTPNEGCSHNKDYASIDLTVIPDDYLPRTNYVPACSPEEYLERTPKWNGKPVTAFYRHVHRRMIAPTGERSLIAAIIPPGPAHPNPVVSVAYNDNLLLLAMSGAACSIPYDFFLKSTGKSDCYGEQFSSFPLPEEGPVRSRIIHRALRLNCLTTHYAALWNEVATSEIRKDGFAKVDPRLPSWQTLSTTWTRDSALRTPFARRQALVELDALAALSLGLTVDQLQLIYRVQFPVLQQYERETYYDQRGKIVFTTNRGLSGVGLTRKQWEEVEHAPAGAPLPEWARDEQGAFVPPFDRCDREADMAQAYHHFAESFGMPQRS